MSMVQAEDGSWVPRSFYESTPQVPSRAGVVTIIAVTKPDANLTLGMGPKAPQLRSGTGIAKYDEIDRPQFRPYLEYKGESLCVVDLNVVLEGWLEDRDVEGDFRRLMAWAARNDAPHATPLKVYGPVPYAELTWCLTNVSLDGMVQRADDGRLVRQEVTLELTEWVNAPQANTTTSPAAAAIMRQNFSKIDLINQAMRAPAQLTHTVRAGETLWALATRYLGEGKRYREIADMNGVGDPRKLRVGTVLRIPAR